MPAIIKAQFVCFHQRSAVDDDNDDKDDYDDNNDDYNSIFVF